VSQDAGRRRGRRGPWGWLRLLGLQLVLVVALLELGLRAVHALGLGFQNVLYLPGAHSAYEGADTLPELLRLAGLRSSPGEVVGDFRLSSRSLRTPEYRVRKEPGTRRVVVLGDSFTWASGGVPYEELWHSRLAADLAARSGAPVERISLGVPAVGPDFELRMWQIEGRRLAPDLVLLALFVGNDFLDLRGALGDRDALDRWSRRCYLVRLYRNVRLLRRSRWGMPDPGDPPAAAPEDEGPLGVVLPERSHLYLPDAPELPREMHLDLVARRLVVCDRSRREDFDAALERIDGILRTLAEDVASIGAELVVLLIPDEFQFDDALFDEAIRDRGLDRDAYDLDRPQRELARLLSAHGTRFLDLLPVFRAHVDEGPFFRRSGTHWNVAGNRLAAAELAAFLAGDAPSAER